MKMADRDAAARAQIRTRLAQSREEISMLLDPPETQGEGGAASANGHAGFPRSRTMQMLMSSRGLGTLGALAGGLLLARPALALRLLRFVPAGGVAKMLMARVLGSLRSKQQNAP